jgi:hypothetical protein
MALLITAKPGAFQAGSVVDGEGRGGEWSSVE